MKRRLVRATLVASLLSAASLSPNARAAEPNEDLAKANRVKIGQEAPLFEVTTLDGQKFSLTEQRGKVVVLDFFATWCGPCLAEMPHLEKELWQKKKGDKRFAMIALGREHTNEELKPFQQKNKFTFPIAGDVKREIFSRYADAYIPRLVVIDAKGQIIDQVVGFTDAEFKLLMEKIDAELAKAK